MPNPAEWDCERCLSHWQSELSRIQGVLGTAINRSRATLRIAYEPDVVSPDLLAAQAQQIHADLAARIAHQTLLLNDLDCPDCAATIQKAAQHLPGVLWAEANFAAAQMHVEFERAQVSLNDITRLVQAHGIRACPLTTHATEDTPAPTRWRAFWEQHRRLCLSILTGCLTLLGLLAQTLRIEAASIGLFASAMGIGGWPIARSGWLAARARALDMNLLVTLATLGAAGLGEWAEGATVIALFTIGNQLQAGAMDRTRRSIRALMELTPATARVRRNGEVVQVPIDLVGLEETALVRPGERIPTDGVIVQGESVINEAPITGESLPVEKGPGAMVFGGTLNGPAALEIRVTRRSQETLLARILHRVEEAQAQRAPAQEFIDRFARVYTPLVVLLAMTMALLPPLLIGLWQGQLPAQSALWAHWLNRALATLLIACPCALVISTPVAIVTAIGHAARQGALIKGGAYLEALSSLRVLLYDKTGTLTEGRFRIERVYSLRSLSEAEVLALAAALEAHSEHPLARAFVHLQQIPLPVQDVEALPGRGVQGAINGVQYWIGNVRLMQHLGVALEPARAFLEEAAQHGQTAILLADSQGLVGVVTLADTPRPEAAEAIRALAELGIAHQAMLTGDNERAARRIAQQLGLEDAQANLLPEDKLALIPTYRARYGAVGMVGEGINDAPALASANVGIVMGVAGSDTALEAADIALMGDDLSRLPALVRLSRRTRRIVQQNVAFALLTKGLLLLTACLMVIPLWLAVLGDVGVSLLVTLNALRLRR
jgi:Cd2+/Zn2+-exporting ATPase